MFGVVCVHVCLICTMYLHLIVVPSIRTSRRGTEYLVKWRDLTYSQATWEDLGVECGLKGAGRAIQEFEKLRETMDPKKRERKERKRGKPSKSSKNGKSSRASGVSVCG